MPHPDQVNLVALSPDHKTIATACLDNKLRFWDIQTGKQVGKNMDHFNEIEVMTFSPDGKYLATGEYDSTVRLWNVKSTESLDFNFIHDKKNLPEGVSDVQFSKSGDYIYYVYPTGDDFKVYVSDLETGELLVSFNAGGSVKIFPYQEEYILTCDGETIKFLKWTEKTSHQ